MEYVIDGKKLRKIMIDRNINTINELSEVTGVGRDTLSRVIKGNVNSQSKRNSTKGVGFTLRNGGV